MNSHGPITKPQESPIMAAPVSPALPPTHPSSRRPGIFLNQMLDII